MTKPSALERSLIYSDAIWANALTRTALAPASQVKPQARLEQSRSSTFARKDT